MEIESFAWCVKALVIFLLDKEEKILAAIYRSKFVYTDILAEIREWEVFRDVGPISSLFCEKLLFGETIWKWRINRNPLLGTDVA